MWILLLYLLFMFILLKSYNFWSTEKENIKIRIKRRAFVNLKYMLIFWYRWFLKLVAVLRLLY